MDRSLFNEAARGLLAQASVPLQAPSAEVQAAMRSCGDAGAQEVGDLGNGVRVLHVCLPRVVKSTRNEGRYCDYRAEGFDLHFVFLPQGRRWAAFASRVVDTWTEKETGYIDAEDASVTISEHSEAVGIEGPFAVPAAWQAFAAEAIEAKLGGQYPAARDATSFVVGYDTEYVQDPDWSLRAVEAVAAVHRRHGVPATFFFVGRLLEMQGERYAAVLGGDDLFDVQSHTYSHMSLKGEEPERLAQAAGELQRTADLVERFFGARPIGVCGPGGYEDGLKDCPRMLGVLAESGARYLSTQGRGPAGTIPAPLSQPYWYGDQGFPNLLELPAQDFHENVLKGYQQVPAYWPPILPWGLPNRPPATPEEEFAYFRQGMEYALAQGLSYYRTYFHPWSIYRFSQDAKTIDLLLGHALGIGLEVTSCTRFAQRLFEGGPAAPGDA